MYFCISIALMTLSWVCTGFLITGAFLLYSGRHQLAPSGEEFRGIAQLRVAKTAYMRALLIHTKVYR